MSLPVNVQKMIDAMPLLQELEMVFEYVGEGICRCSMPVNSRLVNPHGGLHGGITFTLADTGMGFALFSLLQPDERTSTLSMSIRYVKPVKGRQISAECRVVHRQDHIVLTEARMLDDGGEMVALAEGTFYISRRERGLEIED